jgi:hypothetical protein
MCVFPKMERESTRTVSWFGVIGDDADQEKAYLPQARWDTVTEM